MNARRKRLMQYLLEAEGPVTGSELSRRLGVSRQVVVADVALLRAGGEQVVATPSGYILVEATNGHRTPTAQLAVCHDPADTGRELFALIDAGVRIVDVTVEHPLYGDLHGNLLMETREDVASFLARVERDEISLLSKLTGGIHLHRVEFDRMSQLRRAREALRRLGFLIET